MANDAKLCRALLTPDSYSFYDRFAGYGLMPCLPTNLTMESQKQSGTHTILTASMPAGGGKKYLIRLSYDPASPQLLLDIPDSLRRALGERWENKMKLAEQLYLLMKQNLGDKLTCDQLEPLLQ